MRRPGRWLPMWSGSPASASRSGAAVGIGIHEHHAFPDVDRRREQPARGSVEIRELRPPLGDDAQLRRRGRSATRGTSTRSRRTCSRNRPASPSRGAGTGCGRHGACRRRAARSRSAPRRRGSSTKSPGSASCSTWATTCHVRAKTSALLAREPFVIGVRVRLEQEARRVVVHRRASCSVGEPAAVAG